MNRITQGRVRTRPTPWTKLIIAGLACVAVLSGCEEMPVSPQVEPAPETLDESLLTAAAAPNPGIQVALTGFGTNWRGKPVANFFAIWPNLERPTTWAAFAWPWLPRSVGFRSPRLYCPRATRRSPGCTTIGEGSSFSLPQATYDYTARFRVYQYLPVLDRRGRRYDWRRIRIGYAEFTVPAATSNEAPTAAFTPNCTDLDCAFDGSTSSDPDGTIASYAWDFGDGNSGSGATPSHSYGSAGNYDVTLTVTDDDGATGSTTQQVTVMAANQSPTAAFTPSCTDLDCAFDGSGSSDPDGTIASYAWVFGDGSAGTGATPNHSYASAGTYDVTLTVTDDDGATGATTRQVTVMAGNQSPTAVFTPSCTDLDCAFDGSTSSDPDGTIASYAWDFGDGTSGSGATPSHAYASAGNYDVTLTVTDDDGATGSTTQQLTVTAANQSPTAAFTPSCTDLDCTFDGSASGDPDGTIASYAWDFGDGTSGSGATPSHAYASAGNYDVTLTVTDDDGATGSTTQQVTVMAANQSPTAAFTPSCTDLDCAFDGSTSSDPDGTIASYAWDFGDGISGSGATPSHAYASAGNYDVTLTVTDNTGATDATTQQVTVSAPGSGITKLGATILGEAAGDRWGRSVAVSNDGTRVVAGAVQNGGGGANAGHVRVFRWTGGAWVQMGQDIDGTPGAPIGAGRSVDISGNGQRMAIGSKNFNGGRGRVTIYESVGNNWVQMGPPIQASTSVLQFGTAVSLSNDGTRVAVGSPGASGGTAEVFQWSGGNWTRVGPPILGSSTEALGTDVALSGGGTRVVVGAIGAASGQGALAVYDWTGSTWSQVGGPMVGTGGSNFGQNVTISQDGRRVAGYSGGSGDFARVFELSGSNWVQMGPDFNVPGAFDFHQNLDLSGTGDRVLIGSMFEGQSSSGTVRVFDWNSGGWSQVGMDVNGDGPFARSGWSVSMSADGRSIASGMPDLDSNGSLRGGVAVYTIN